MNLYQWMRVTLLHAFFMDIGDHIPIKKVLRFLVYVLCMDKQKTSL